MDHTAEGSARTVVPVKRKLVSRACTICAKKKARCSGDQPCENCTRTGNVCEYTSTQRRGPKKRLVTELPSSPNRTSPQQTLAREYPDRTTTPTRDITSQTQTHTRPHIHQRPHLESQPSSSSFPAASNQHQHDSLGATSSVGTNSDGSTFADRLLKTGGPHLKTFIDMLPEDLAITQEGGNISETGGAQENELSPLVNIQEPAVHDQHHHHHQQHHAAGFTRRETMGSLWAAETTGNGAGKSPEFLGETNLEVIADHPAILSLLYNIYWCFVHPLWPVVYRPGYDMSTAATSSPLLHNSILAICCRFDLDRQSQDIPGLSSEFGLTTVDTRALGDIFFRRAQEQLDKAQRVSNISTVQALIMLSLRELARGHTREAWLSSGTAIRLVFDLNIHKQSLVVNRTPAEYIKEQESSRVLWGCYVLDKYISMIMGRPFMMHYIDIEAPLPSVNEADEYALWESDARQVIPNIAMRFSGVRSRTISIFNRLARLAVILERILDSLYSRRYLSHTSHQSTKELDEALVQWQKQSPDAFDQPPNSFTTPNILLLRLWYNLCLILVHRKYIKTGATYSRDGQLKTPHTICVEAANEINHTMEMMETSIGLYRSPHLIVFIIFQAGIIHLANSTADDTRIAVQGRNCLHQCIKWLNQIAATYALAPRYCHVLFSLEELSKRELKSSMELDEIMANRRGTRPSSPEFDFEAILNGFAPASPPMQEIAHGPASTRNGLNVDHSTTSRMTQPTTGPLQSTSTVSDPLYNLHDSFFLEMPLGLPNNVSGVAQWDDFTTNYGNLVHFDTPYQL